MWAYMEFQVMHNNISIYSDQKKHQSQLLLHIILHMYIYTIPCYLFLLNFFKFS